MFLGRQFIITNGVLSMIIEWPIITLFSFTASLNFNDSDTKTYEARISTAFFTGVADFILKENCTNHYFSMGIISPGSIKIFSSFSYLFSLYRMQYI